jgi:porin
MGIKRIQAIAFIFVLLNLAWIELATAQVASDKPDNAKQRHIGFADSEEDPAVLLRDIRIRNSQNEALFPVSILEPVRDSLTKIRDNIYDATNIKLGLSFHHVFQGASNVLPGAEKSATATDFDFVGTWELFNQGQPTQGQLYFGVEGRWDYNTIGPQNIGFASLGAAGGTANSFSAYDPTFIMRNLYFKQGGAEAGWVYRFGKITPDSMLLTNRNITPNTTFLSNAGTGMFVASFPDSGFGAAGAVYFGDRVYLGGLVSDANADRYNWGDIGAGDLYTAVELGVKIAPRSPKASYSKFLLWHSDGTKDGTPINANTGSSGWGYSIVIEQELAEDGRPVIIGRYGQSFDNAAIYDQQAAVHFLLYEPFGKFKNDVIGASLNWIQSSASNTRDEYNIEAFYRFPLFPQVDVTLSYQYVIDPAFSPGIDNSSVVSLRLTTSF